MLHLRDEKPAEFLGEIYTYTYRDIAHIRVKGDIDIVWILITYVIMTIVIGMSSETV